MGRIQTGEARIRVRNVGFQAECVRELNRWMAHAWKYPRGTIEREFYFRMVRVHRYALRKARGKLQKLDAYIRARRRHDY